MLEKLKRKLKGRKRRVGAAIGGGLLACILALMPTSADVTGWIQVGWNQSGAYWEQACYKVVSYDSSNGNATIQMRYTGGVNGNYLDYWIGHLKVYVDGNYYGQWTFPQSNQLTWKNGSNSQYYNISGLKPGTHTISTQPINTAGAVTQVATKYTISVPNPSFNQTVYVRYEQANGSYSGWSAVINKNYTYGSTVSWSRGADSTYKAASISYSATGAATKYVTVYRQTYTLDLNGNINDANYGNLQSAATANVYVNGSLVASNVNDYCSQLRAGSTYQFNLTTKSGYNYKGLASGALSGTLNGAVNTRAKYYSVHTLTIDPNGGTYKGSSSNSTMSAEYHSFAEVNEIPKRAGYTFVGWKTTSGNASVLTGGSEQQTSITRKDGYTDSDGSHYTKYTMNYSNTSSGWAYPNILMTYYNFEAGHTYVLSYDVRVNNASGMNYANIRHAAFRNNWIAPSSSINNTTSGWSHRTTTTTLAATATQNNTTYTTNPCVEMYVGIASGNTGVLDFDLKNLTIYDQTTGKYVTSKSNTRMGSSIYMGAQNSTIQAVWQANYTTITYDPNGGSLNVTDTNIVKNTNGTAYANTKYDTSWFWTLGMTASRTGYTFAGFYDSPTGGTQVYGSDYNSVTTSKYYNSNHIWKYSDSSTTYGWSNGVTLYARWTPNTYSVDLNATLNGTQYWALSANGTNFGTADIYIDGKLVADDVSDYCTKWAYGSKWEVKDIKAKSGYVYVGNSSYSGTVGINGVSINLPFKSQHQNLISHWAFGFKNGEGNNNAKNAFLLSTTSQPTTTYGSSVTYDASNAIEIPNGFSLLTQLGTSDISGSWTLYNFPTTFTQKAKAMNFEYDYTPITYTITYDLNGGTLSTANPSTYNVLYGVTFSNKPTRTGYTFVGWSMDGQKVTGINVGKNATFSSASDLYAQLKTRTTGNKKVTAMWVKNEYVIKYNANGGSGTMNSQVVKNGETITLTKNAFTNTGYTFKNWTGTQTIGALSTNSTVTVVNPLTLSDGASVKNIGSQTIITNDSSPVVDTNNLNSSSTTTAKVTSNGWVTDSSLDSKLARKVTFSAGGNGGFYSSPLETYSSNYKNLFGGRKFRITFKAKATTAMTLNSVGLESATGNKSISLTTSWKEYEITGQMNTAQNISYHALIFYSPSTAASVYIGDVSIAFDYETTLKANWNANSYTNILTYNANGGSGAPGSQTATVTYPNTQSTFTLSSTKPTRTGYTFAGWYTAASGGTLVSGTYKVGSANYAGNQSATLYAHWNNILAMSGKNFYLLEGTTVDSNVAITGNGYDKDATEKYPDKLKKVTYPMKATSNAGTKDVSSSIEVEYIEYDGSKVSKIDTSKTGTYTVHYILTYENTTLRSTRKIEVLKASTPSINAGDRYFRVGSTITTDVLKENITANDKYDGDIVASVTIKNLDKVDTTTAGEYEITYFVTNSSNKTITKKATIHMIEYLPDNQADEDNGYRYVRKDCSTLSDYCMEYFDEDSKWVTDSTLKTQLKNSLNKSSSDEAVKTYKFSSDDVKNAKNK